MSTILGLVNAESRLAHRSKSELSSRQRGVTKGFESTR